MDDHQDMHALQQQNFYHEQNQGDHDEQQRRQHQQLWRQQRNDAQWHGEYEQAPAWRSPSKTARNSCGYQPDGDSGA